MLQLSVYKVSPRYLVGFHLNNLIDLFIELNYSEEEVLFQILLDKEPNTTLDFDKLLNFTKLCHTHTIQCVAEYNRAGRCTGTRHGHTSIISF